MNITNSLLHTAYKRERKPTQVIITIYLSALLLLIAITISSCSKKVDVGVTPSFLFGTSFGECGGNCDTYFAISGNNLYGTTGKYLPGPLVINYNSPLPEEKYRMAKDLMDQLPQTLFVQNIESQTFGCPDCHDQGGIHIEYLSGAQIIKWHIDTDTSVLTSSELKEFVVKTLDVVQKLKE